jgi:hypothetical protein
MIASVEKTGDGGYAEKGTRLAFRFSRHKSQIGTDILPY